MALAHSFMAVTALLAAAADQPTGPEVESAAVFALIDSNEWCPGGSVFLDLRTGAFMLYPRLARRACQGRTVQVEHGTITSAELQRLRSTYAEVSRAGLRRADCALVISNGGPQAVVITAPGFSGGTPENLGCWSAEAHSLYEDLLQVFGTSRERRD